MALITKDQFLTFAIQAFVHEGATLETAEIVANVLLEASLSGYDSHGIMRIPRYIEKCRDGFIIASEKPIISKDFLGTAMVDGRLGFGPLAAMLAVNTAAARAKEFGVSCVTAYNTNDVARLGSYLHHIGELGLIMILMVNDAGVGASVAPWGSAHPFLSTNPIAAVIPRSSGEPILIDISTGITAVGKLRMAANSGKNVAPGLLIKPDGTETTDPNLFFQSPKGAALLPLGGLLAGHKGFALSILTEALAGALSSSGCSAGSNKKYVRNGLFVLALDPEKFGGRRLFENMIDSFVANIKVVPTLAGVDEIIIPGERSARERVNREKNGIPVDDITWKKTMEICKEMDIQL